MNLFTEKRKPIHPPMDAVTRLRQLTAAGISEDDARKIVGREVDREVDGPVPAPRRTRPPNNKIASTVSSPIVARLGVPAVPTPDSPVITNRFRRETAKPAKKPRFNPVAHFSLVEVSHVGQMEKPSGSVPVQIGFTAWPDDHDNARYNGAIHISGLSPSTINLSFDALAALLALSPQIEKYLETNSEKIAAAEVIAANARRARRESRS